MKEVNVSFLLGWLGLLSLSCKILGYIVCTYIIMGLQPKSTSAVQRSAAKKSVKNL